MQHEMKLNDAPFENIKSGTKTIEMRLNDEKRQQLRIHDHLIFQKASNPDETLSTRIIALHYFPTFRDMTTALQPALMGYTSEHMERLAQGDHGMYAYYSKEDEATYGVVGIEICLL